MMGEGWEWIHLATVGMVFAGCVVWVSDQGQKRWAI